MNLTAILNIVFLAVALILTVIYLIGREETEEDDIVDDPVCGSEVMIKTADYCYMYEETIYYFDTEECRNQFRNDPGSFLDGGGDDQSQE